MKNIYLLLFIAGCLMCAKGFAQNTQPPASAFPALRAPSGLNMNDGDAGGFFYLNVSTPVQATPMYTYTSGSITDNYGRTYQSGSFQKSSPLSFFGLKIEPVFRLINTNFVKLKVSGSFTYTNSLVLSSLVSAVDSSSNSSGVTEFDYTYGGELSVGPKFVKLVGMYEGGYRNIASQTEIDDTNNAYTSSTTETATAEYNYTRYGAGLSFRLNSDGDPESYLKLMYYNEKPSYSNLKITGYGLELKSIINISFQYFPNYEVAPISGLSSKLVANPNSQQDFWYISVGKSFSF